MGMLPANTQLNSTNYARECSCVAERRTQRLITAANIPPRYWDSTLENYDTHFPGADDSLSVARMFAEKFVADFLTDDKKGLLIHGDIGTGKTHLAVSIIRELITRYGIGCVFVDQQELFKEIQYTYSNRAEETERQVLAPVLKSEVIVLDDMGLVKLSDWAAEMVSLILTTRYNKRLTTIITTNYPNRFVPVKMGNVEPIKHDTTLGDRISDRALSRLNECCIPIEVKGMDFRRTVKKARP